MRMAMLAPLGSSHPTMFSKPRFPNEQVFLYHFALPKSSQRALLASLLCGSPKLHLLSDLHSSYAHQHYALKSNSIFPLSTHFSSDRFSRNMPISVFSCMRCKGSQICSVLQRKEPCRMGSTNFRRQGIKIRAVGSNMDGERVKQVRDLDLTEGGARKHNSGLQRLQDLEERTAQLKLMDVAGAHRKMVAVAGLSKNKLTSKSGSDGENLENMRVIQQSFGQDGGIADEVPVEDYLNLRTESEVRGPKSDKDIAEKRKYLRNVLAIRNKGRQIIPAGDSYMAKEEIQVFEEWASMKLKEEGPIVASVIEEMRVSLFQNLNEASEGHPSYVVLGADSSSSASQTDMWITRSRTPKLPTERDPLAGVAVKPIVVKRRSRVPEDWNGPGGTVVLINKPEGWSSFAVCGKLRHMLGVKKVGHAGTLDPLSTGLLIVCVGKATKLADSYQAMTKVYSGTMRLGETTPSLDAGTPVSERLPWEHIQEDDIRRAADSFLGDIMQVPPMYSAIKVKGERLYTKARRGEEIEVPARPVTVYDFQLKRNPQNRQDWDFHIVCSKGTYIRSLCADVAQSLNSCAFLTALRRDRIGNLSVEDAWPVEELETHYREILKVPFHPYGKASRTNDPDEEDSRNQGQHRNMNKDHLSALKALKSGSSSNIGKERNNRMNEAEVNKQIQQMVHFIRQEAEEKANEIAISTEEEFNVDKLRMVEAEKKRIRADYDRKERLVEIRNKTEYSTHLNAQRLRYLHAQDDHLRRMREAAERQLATISNQHGPYAKFLEALIIQGLLRLREPAVQIRCRKEDLHLVQAVIQSACEIYANKANLSVPKVSVDEKVFLPGPPQPGVYGSTCLGGLVLATKDGHIVLDNTLNARMQIVFKQQLPEIRKRLYGVRQGLFGGKVPNASPERR